MEEVTVFPVEPDKAESPAEPKGSKYFTSEERATIIAKAKEVGFEKVANEFGIRVRLIRDSLHKNRECSDNRGNVEFWKFVKFPFASGSSTL